MLSYDLSESKGPLYKSLYHFILEDIEQGRLYSAEDVAAEMRRDFGI